MQLKHKKTILKVTVKMMEALKKEMKNSLQEIEKKTQKIGRNQ